MTESSLPKLLAALSAERAALLSFLSLLEREQSILVENATDPLLELCDRKSASALNLNQIVEKRNALIQQILPQAHIDAWLKANSPQGYALWQEILSLGKRAQELNQTNGGLIQMKLRRNQQMLAALSNAADKANLYGPNGQTSFTPGSGRSLGSG